jgi:hypothetical protein
MFAFLKKIYQTQLYLRKDNKNFFAKKFILNKKRRGAVRPLFNGF